MAAPPSQNRAAVRPELRALIQGQFRFIVTVETAKHRLFQFLSTDHLPDHRLIAIGSADAFHLSVLSSRIHVVYALAAGGTLEDRPVFNKTRCFDPFPFPDCTEPQMAKIRKLAEELDAHRKRAQAQHGLGLTDLYNVLEKLRAGTALTPKERALHDAALVSTLKQLHDELDAAVAAAYGWLWPLDDDAILERVVALNAARAAEEAAGTIRWLRPEYQIPRQKGEGRLQKDQPQLGLTDAPATKATSRKSIRGRAKSDPTSVGASGFTPDIPASAQSKIGNRISKIPWPKTLAERAKAVESALTAEPKPVTAAELATRFARAKPADVDEILDTLAALGRARRGDAQGTFLR